MDWQKRMSKHMDFRNRNHSQKNVAKFVMMGLFVMLICFIPMIFTHASGSPSVSVKNVQKNTTFQTEGIKYKVTKKAGKKAGTLEVVKLTKKKSSYVIPDTVKVNKKTYKVTSIGSNVASKKAKKVTSVTFGRYVKTIGKNAFSGCSKLKKVVFGTGLRTVKSGAFSGCKKKGSYYFKYDGGKKVLKNVKAAQAFPKSSQFYVPRKSFSYYDYVLSSSVKNGIYSIMSYDPSSGKKSDTSKTTEKEKDDETTTTEDSSSYQECNHDWKKHTVWAPVNINACYCWSDKKYYTAPCDYNKDWETWPKQLPWDKYVWEVDENWVVKNTDYHYAISPNTDTLFIYNGDVRFAIVPTKEEVIIEPKTYWSNGYVDTELTYPEMGGYGGTTILIGWKQETYYQCSKCGDSKY